MHGAGDFGKEFEVPRHALHVATHAVQRQAGVQALEVGEFFSVLAQMVADRIEDVLALGNVHARPRPRIEGPPR